MSHPSRSIRLGVLGVLAAVAASSWACEASAQGGQPLIPRAVVKLIIDHPALAGYLHPEVAGRVPLVISNHLLADGVTPSKFGQPVRILGDREVGAQPHIRFKSFAMEGSRAKTVLEYDVEGVEAVFNLQRSDSGWWSVVDAQVAKRNP